MTITLTITGMLFLTIITIQSVLIIRKIPSIMKPIIEYDKRTRQFKGIAESVNRARELAERGRHHECLVELDRSCKLIELSTCKWRRLSND